MKIEFAHNEITAFSMGNFVVTNNGPFDVPDAGKDAFLNAKHTLTDKDGNSILVNVFKPAKQLKLDKEDAEENYPEGFPHSDLLIKAGYTYADAVLLDAEQLKALPGIGARSAKAILEFHKGETT